VKRNGVRSQGKGCYPKRLVSKGNRRGGERGEESEREKKKKKRRTSGLEADSGDEKEERTMARSTNYLERKARKRPLGESPIGRRRGYRGGRGLLRTRCW